MAQIDSLDIQINASVESANVAISNLVKELTRLENALRLTGVDKFAKSMDKATVSMSGIEKSSTSAARGLNRVGKSAKSLASVFGSLYANFFWVRRAFQKGLGAIEISSDLTEVQNVVDVTFGNMASMLDDFAETSRQKFGLSELSAKRYASQFQAMFSAMGVSAQQIEGVNDRLTESGVAAYASVRGYEFAANSAQEMSLNLTKLAADMASFFNQDPADVAKRIQAGVISGQSRALRQYGLDLTIATLQSWALARGINQDVQEMTQAEKTMLRYQYVMEQMAMAQGDFTRTSQTWANQVKLLRQNFEALGAVIGTALIGWIKPTIIAINNAMNTIIALVQRAVNAIGKLMGWQIEISQIGAGLGDGADDLGGALEDAEDGAAGTAGGLGKANKAAKELKKTILGFDELNVLNGNDDSAGDDGAGGAGGGAGGFGNISDWLKNNGDAFGGELTKYKSDIDNWFEFGRRISDTLTKALEDIQWEEIYKKAERFGTGLADFLNGLITPNLFSALGNTIAGALNTALHFLDSFGTRFDWKNFGSSLAAGLNRFFKEFKFSLLAKNINTFAHGILDTIITFIEKTDWSQIGEKIGTFLLEIDFIGIGKKIGKAIWSAINAGFRLYGRMFEVAPFETALLGLVGITRLLKTDAIGNFVKMIGKGNEAARVFAKAVNSGDTALSGLALAFPKLTKPIGALQSAMLQFHLGMMNGVGTAKSLHGAFDTLRGSMGLVSKGLLGIGAGIAEFVVVKNIFADILDGTDNLLLKITELAGAFAAAGLAFSVVFGFPAGLVASGIVAATAAFGALGESIEKEIDTSAWNAVGEALKNPGGTPIEDVTNHYTEAFNKIEEGFGQISKAGEGLGDSRDRISETAKAVGSISDALEVGAIVTESKCAEIKKHFDNLLADTKSVFEQEYDVIMLGIAGALGDAAEEAGLSTQAIAGFMNELKSEYDKAVQEISDSQAKLDEDLANGFISQEKWAEGTLTNTQKLIELNGGVDAYAASIGDLNSAIENVDFSELIESVDGVYQLDMKNLSAQISQVGNAFTDASKSVTSASDEMQLALDDYVNKANAFGRSDIASAFGELAAIDAQHAESAKTQLQTGLDDYSNLVLHGLTNQIPAVVDKALADYENLSPIAKFSTTEEEFVGRALEQYQSNVIDKAVDKLDTMYQDVGIEGSTFAQDAAKEIYDSLWQEVPVENNGQVEMERRLKSDWKTTLTNVATDVKIDSKDIGKNVPEGAAEGIKENEGATDNPIKRWINRLIARVTGKDGLDEHSPSLVAKDWGKNLIAGFDAGIDENTTISITTAGAWMSSVKDKIMTGLSDLMTNMKTDTDSGLTTTADTFSTKLDEMKNTASEIYESIKDATSSAFSDVKDAISESISGAKDVVDDGVRGMESIFSGMHFEFPDIKLPHFSWSTFDIGWGISLPSISIDWYAKGGFPEDGLFMANHGELVGQFSNGKTAVANNEQIIEGIQGGVTRAIVQYLPEIIRDAVSAADTGGGDIYIGDEQIARAANRGNRKIDRRYNPVMQY